MNIEITDEDRNRVLMALGCWLGVLGRDKRLTDDLLEANLRTAEKFGLDVRPYGFEPAQPTATSNA